MVAIPFKPAALLLTTCAWAVFAMCADAQPAPGHPTLVVTTGHTGGITDLTVSPSGDYLLSAGEDGVVRLWHVPSASEVRRFRPAVGIPTTVGAAGGSVYAFSERSTDFLAVDSTLYLAWDARTGQEQAHVEGGSSFVRSGAGNAFAVSFGTSFAAFSPPRDTVLQVRPPAYMEGLEVSAVSPDGSRVLTSNDALGEVRLWDVSTLDSHLLTLEAGFVSGFNAAFSSDGARLYTWASDGAVYIWDSSTGEMLGNRRLPVERDTYPEILPLADGRFLYVGSTSGDITSSSWLTVERDGRVLHRFGPHIDDADGVYAHVTSFTVTPDGSIVYTGDSSGQIYAWSMTDSEGPPAARRARVDLIDGSGGDPALALPYAPAAAWDGRRLYLSDAPGPLLSSSDGPSRVWVIDPLHGEQPLRKRLDGLPSGSQAFSAASGRALTIDSDGTRWLWDLERGTQPDSIGVGYTPIPSHVAVMSPDGSLLLDGTTIWNLETRSSLGLTLNELPGPISAGAFSSDGRLLVTGHFEDGLRLWSTSDGRLVGSLGTDESPRDVAFGPAGRTLATAGEDGRTRIWSLEDNEQTDVLLGHDGSVNAVAFAPDGATLASGGADGTVRLWDLATGTERSVIRAFPGQGDHGGVGLVDYTDDGKYLVAAGRLERAVRIWDADSTRLVRTLTYEPRGGAVATEPVQRFPDAPFRANLGALGGGSAVALDANFTAWTWDTDDARRVEWSPSRTERMGGRTASSVAIAPDGRTAAVGFADGHVVRIDAATAAPIDTADVIQKPDETTEAVLALAMDTTGRVLAAGEQFGDEPAVIRLWDIEDGSVKTIFECDGEVYALAFGPDGRSAFIGERESNDVVQVALSTGEIQARHSLDEEADGGGPADAVAVSPDGTRLAVAQAFGRVQVWDLESGRLIRSWDTHRSGMRVSEYFEVVAGVTGNLLRKSALAFTPDNRLLVGAESGALALYDRDGLPLRRYRVLNGRALAVDVLYESGRLVARALTSAGSLYAFALETGDLLSVRHQLPDGRWAAADPAGRFDTGNLLVTEGARWILPDAALDPLPVDAFLRDFYEPELMRRRLDGEAFAAVPAPAQLSRVLPEVEIAEMHQDTDSTFSVEVSIREGARDTDALGGARDLRLLRDGRLVGWRDGPLWKGGEQEATVTFTGIALPSGADSITVHAYAFNADGVKAPTSLRRLGIPRPPADRGGTAYVISMGVNKFADPVWNLSFAAADARAYQSVLPEHLEGQFDRVVTVPLIADQVDGSTSATKTALRSVLARLAGTAAPEDGALLARLPESERLRPATPDDAIFLTFSTHGFTDSTGTFYLLPEDVAAGTGGQLTPSLFDSAVSSDDLTAWLRSVDAGSFVMVVDACHSEASVQTPGFKPGPFGSRGLGQLAYSKGMQVIAASQSDDVALEIGALQHGLLTYALVREGLENGRAWATEEDGLTVDEWLRWGAARVPDLQRDVQEGTLVWNGRGVKRTGDPSDSSQSPAVFDFAEDGKLTLNPRQEAQ